LYLGSAYFAEYAAGRPKNTVNLAAF